MIVLIVVGHPRGPERRGPRIRSAVARRRGHGACLGFLLGYLLGGLSGGFGTVARTTSIEVGMQNSGLGAVLAQAHFANPLTAIPSAISAITHCIIGSALAAFWSRRPIRRNDGP